MFTGIQAVTPTSETFADLDHVKDFAELYGADLTDLAHELHQSKRLLDRMPSDNKPESLVAFIGHIERYREAFPEIYRLGSIAISLPVSTASCERSFSALRHIKTWVRNALSNEKLDSLAIFAIEGERTRQLDNKQVINAFVAGRKNRRIALI